MTYEKCAPEIMLDVLEGSWHGGGSGSYPETGEFEYIESIEFRSSMKGFLIYQQSTTSLQGSPMHQEMGYLRVGEAGHSLELVVAQPTGIAEALVGNVTGDGNSFRFELHSDGVITTPSAKEVTRTGRYFHLTHDELSYELHMEAVGQDYQLHLTASLARVTAR